MTSSVSFAVVNENLERSERLQMQYEDLFIHYQNLKSAANDESEKLHQRCDTLEDQNQKKHLVINDLLKNQHQIYQSLDISANELAEKKHQIQALHTRLDQIDAHAVNLEQSERLRMQYEDLLVHHHHLKSTTRDECKELVQQNDKLQDQTRKNHLVITDLLKNQHEIYNLLKASNDEATEKKNQIQALQSQLEERNVELQKQEQSIERMKLENDQAQKQTFNELLENERKLKEHLDELIKDHKTQQDKLQNQLQVQEQQEKAQQNQLQQNQIQLEKLQLLLETGEESKIKNELNWKNELSAAQNEASRLKDHLEEQRNEMEQYLMQKDHEFLSLKKQYEQDQQTWKFQDLQSRFESEKQEKEQGVQVEELLRQHIENEELWKKQLEVAEEQKKQYKYQVKILKAEKAKEILNLQQQLEKDRQIVFDQSKELQKQIENETFLSNELQASKEQQTQYKNQLAEQQNRIAILQMGKVKELSLMKEQYEQIQQQSNTEKAELMTELKHAQIQLESEQEKKTKSDLNWKKELEIAQSQGSQLKVQLEEAIDEMELLKVEKERQLLSTQEKYEQSQIEEWKSQIEAVQERENEYKCKLKHERGQIEQYKQEKEIQLSSLQKQHEHDEVSIQELKLQLDSAFENENQLKCILEVQQSEINDCTLEKERQLLTIQELKLQLDSMLEKEIGYKFVLERQKTEQEEATKETAKQLLKLKENSATQARQLNLEAHIKQLSAELDQLSKINTVEEVKQKTKWIQNELLQEMDGFHDQIQDRLNHLFQRVSTIEHNLIQCNHQSDRRIKFLYQLLTKCSTRLSQMADDVKLNETPTLAFQSLLSSPAELVEIVEHMYASILVISSEWKKSQKCHHRDQFKIQTLEHQVEQLEQEAQDLNVQWTGEFQYVVESLDESSNLNVGHSNSHMTLTEKFQSLVQHIIQLHNEKKNVQTSAIGSQTIPFFSPISERRNDMTTAALRMNDQSTMTTLASESQIELSAMAKECRLIKMKVERMKQDIIECLSSSFASSANVSSSSFGVFISRFENIGGDTREWEEILRWIKEFIKDQFSIYKMKTHHLEALVDQQKSQLREQAKLQSEGKKQLISYCVSLLPSLSSSSTRNASPETMIRSMMDMKNNVIQNIKQTLDTTQSKYQEHQEHQAQEWNRVYRLMIQSFCALCPSFYNSQSLNISGLNQGRAIYPDDVMSLMSIFQQHLHAEQEQNNTLIQNLTHEKGEQEQLLRRLTEQQPEKWQLIEQEIAKLQQQQEQERLYWKQMKQSIVSSGEQYLSASIPNLKSAWTVPSQAEQIDGLSTFSSQETLTECQHWIIQIFQLIQRTIREQQSQAILDLDEQKHRDQELAHQWKTAAENHEKETLKMYAQVTESASSKILYENPHPDKSADVSTSPTTVETTSVVPTSVPENHHAVLKMQHKLERWAKKLQRRDASIEILNDHLNNLIDINQSQRNHLDYLVPQFSKLEQEKRQLQEKQQEHLDYIEELQVHFKDISAEIIALRQHSTAIPV